MKTVCLGLSAALLLAACGGGDKPTVPSSTDTKAAAQNKAPSRNVNIVGSSTVFPFSSAVAEQFGNKSRAGAPIVESTGSGGGLKLFCDGVGLNTPDIANASRRMKATEYANCQKNGVTDITEVKIGFDGIVVANAKDAPTIEISVKDLFTGLAKQIPTSDTDCTLRDNPYTQWSEINPSLPAFDIEVLGPPPTSGTRDAFVEIAMESGAKQYACLSTLRGAKPGTTDYDAIVAKLPKGLAVTPSGEALAGKKVFTAIAHTVREDGRWIDSGENDNAIVQQLVKTPTAMGVFGYSFLAQNSERLKGAKVDGNLPTFENISNGNYPISRSLYFYVKNAHADKVDGLKGYVAEFTSENAWGELGYLAEKGLIPLGDADRKATAAAARAMTNMDGSVLK